MKLISMQAVNRQTKQRQFYKFDAPISQKRVVTANSNALNDYLQFCFDPMQIGDCDVALIFQVADQTYRLEKFFDGNAYQTQLFATFTHSQTLLESGANALAYVQAHFDVDLSAFAQTAMVNDLMVSQFNGELSTFDEIYQLHQSIEQFAQQPNSSPDVDQVNQEQLQSVNQQLLQV